ncbi:MAG TPA: coenzyme F420-0:L-glutamate ligase [Methanocorpusculum sp.]|nr:coenzyme F420-0:L-glutamate ligase [Methanocorpusculum sp.]
MSISVEGISGIPLIKKGDSIPELICANTKLVDGDIICIASTIVSKANGYVRALNEVIPTQEAIRISSKNNCDPRIVQCVLESSKDIILESPFILSELPFGHIGVRAGIDNSNIEGENIIILPKDPMSDAKKIKDDIKKITGKTVGIIITDTCGRAFRRGQTGIAIGWSGIPAFRDFRGDHDLFGLVLEYTQEAVVDEFAAFSNYIMGESNNGVPAVKFSGVFSWQGHDDMYFNKNEDIIIKAIHI